MKNSVFYRLTGGLMLMLCTCFLTASACSPTRTHTGQKKGYTFNASEKQSFGYAVQFDVNVMNVVDDQPTLAAPKFTYILPVNDPKPDNTLVQVWRSESLKLHKTNMRFC